jgi:hypothetical protein
LSVGNKSRDLDEKYRDLSPAKIVPTLADEGKYIASESSFFEFFGVKR